MTLKFWLRRERRGEKLLLQSAFKVCSFRHSNWDKLSQDASSCWHTPDASTCFSFVIPTPIPQKRLSRGLSRRCGLLPATYEGAPPPSSTCLQPCTRNEQAPAGEQGSCGGSCPSTGQTYPRQTQQGEAPTKRTGSDIFFV